MDVWSLLNPVDAGAAGDGSVETTEENAYSAGDFVGLTAAGRSPFESPNAILAAWLNPESELKRTARRRVDSMLADVVQIIPKVTPTSFRNAAQGVKTDLKLGTETAPKRY